MTRSGVPIVARFWPDVDQSISNCFVLLMITWGDGTVLHTIQQNYVFFMKLDLCDVLAATDPPWRPSPPPGERRRLLER